MHEPSPFHLLDPSQPPGARLDQLGARALPPSLGDHRAAARFYQPSPDLVDAVNVALAVGAPLLVTGEPGTGKTQVAYYLAWQFGLEQRLFALTVRSSTTAEELLYHFDAVGYLHAANAPERREQPLDKTEFRQRGPLWQAYACGGPAVVLLDEIDKAPRDFPNDLLDVLDQHRFHVRETGETISRGAQAPPIVVITSNSERRLPEPFLRRCIFHHIEFTPDLVRRAVAARGPSDFPDLPAELREAALARFLELRARDIRKKPATAELLVWLTVLAARGGVTLEALRDGPLRNLPALTTLVKDRDDLALLR